MTNADAENGRPGRYFLTRYRGFFRNKKPSRSLLGKYPPMDKTPHCLECGRSLSPGVYDYSSDVFGIPLCLKHQEWISASDVSKEAISLYFALKANGVPVVLEWADKQKTVDMAIPGKLYIEVDGEDQQEPDQALIDFSRSIDSWKDRIPTFRVSNALIRNSYYLSLIVDKLTELARDLKKTG
jgi:hypothetical protein